ncbi:MULTISPECIES: hypothetical protein [unclassified Bradyrhizobium]|uniref:hypothetical protein n=1 Tax=unclassified Bradyrhizobium TaxID=2631580 RepID=UPI001FF7096C|nr:MULTISPECIES: hypothetical protein [unclassified Bradyrhizobium]MCK1535821.1 hypothetical protein [Bradyrhizobium sp. 176]MCK1555384.1 hypothetical protein [Bradyrhizobium sp. 171]MCK1688679.1 hypothetical protein [Bradyrhizobium sp. 145]
MEPVHTQNAPGTDKDEAIERLWSEMRVAPEVDFAAIATQVFGPPDTASEIVLARPVYEASVEDTLESLASFDEKHVSSFGDTVRGQVPTVLPGGALLLVGLGATAVGGGAGYLLPLTLFLLTALVIVLAWAWLKPYATEWYEGLRMAPVQLGAFGEARAGAIMGSLALGTAGLVAFLSFDRATDLVLDEGIAKSALVRLAVQSLATQKPELQCRHLIDGASAGKIAIRASYCREGEAWYTAGFSDAGADEWKATVEKLQAKITWSKPTLFGWWKASPRTWTLVPGVTVSANDSEVEVRDAEGKTRKFIPDQNAVLPKVGSKVAVEFRDARGDRALFWNLTAARD